MHLNSQKAIITRIQRLEANVKIDGDVRVTVSKNKNRIDISYDNRKYIGRLRLELQVDKFLVYLMDKANGKISGSTKHSSKSAYMEIKTISDAVAFVKWYVLTTQLAALSRTRT
jgi:hypothetical protein